MSTIEGVPEAPGVYETQNSACANMRGKLLFTFRRKSPVFLYHCEISWQVDGPLGLWKPAPAPTARKAVKGIDQFQLAVTASGLREL